jgi:ECF transporter S component (folate family)
MPSKAQNRPARAAGLSSAKTLTAAGMLVAMGVVLSFFSLSISNILKIGFTFLPLAAGGMLFGPLVGGVIGGLTDVLGYFVRPDGPFFPGFTLNSIVTGVIYGLFFYKKPVTLLRTALAFLTVVLVVNLTLNPLWLSILYGKSFTVLVAARLLKNLIMFPIDTALLYAVLRLIDRAGLRAGKGAK